MGIAEYEALDGMALAELVRTGRVTRAELLEEAIARAEARNPSLNAIITPLFEQARREAVRPADDEAARAPFAGLPFLLKDLDAPLAGVRHSLGLRFLADYRPDHDAEIVVRFRRAGCATSSGRPTFPSWASPRTPSPRRSAPPAIRGTSPALPED